MKSINSVNSHLKKALLLLVFTFGIGLSSFAGQFYHDITTVKGQDITYVQQSYMMSRYWWWMTNFTITGTSTTYTGTVNYYVNRRGDIIFTNPGPVGTYTVSFVLWFEMYENDPNPIYYYESFVLTVVEDCRASTPTLSLGSSSGCNKTLNIASGNLNGATNWQWYSGSCDGGTYVGSGISITVAPSTNTTYYARGEGGCASAGPCGTITVNVNPTTPTFGQSSPRGCDRILGIASGSLNGAANWQWYSGSCGGTPIGSGTEITVSPSTNTTYYARGEGGCISPPGPCGTITVAVNPTTPNISQGSPSGCNRTLNIASGSLNGAANWQWYSGSCGGTPVGSGTSITVSPSTNTNFYARGEGGCISSPGLCGGIVVTVSPTVPTFSISSTNCSKTISIASGNLNGASNWKWYSGSCGGTSVGTGTSISVIPSNTTTYYARGEGACITSGSCGNVTVTGLGMPTGANVYTGNITINTQTQMEAFYNSSNGEKWTKIIGILTLNGNHNSDPISSLCNLNALVEITGNLIINNFNNAANPTSLIPLGNLTTLGCGLNITSNSILQDATLSNLAYIGSSVTIKDNAGLKTINLPQLQRVKGDRLYIQNHPKLETLSFSTSVDSFRFIGKGSSVDISNNGNTANGNLTMNLKKITKIRGALVFNNNDNAGVNNFDNIFTGLTALETAWGKLTITNNDYLGTCCIAASVTVSGTGKRHIISGNTGNCIDSATVLANCGSFNKRSSSNKSYSLGAELTVSPNPSSGLFELNILGDQGGLLTYTICDLTGRTLFNQSLNIGPNDILPLQLGSFADGTYLLKAELNGEVFIKRLMIVK